MPKLAARIFLLFPLVFLAACGMPPNSDYSASSYYADEELMDQERSFHYQDTFNVNQNEFLFNRDQFDIKFSVYPDRAYNFGMALMNNTDEPITIDWNRIEYIDLDGMPHSVIHQGVDYGQPVSAQKPTVVPPRGTLDDLMRPARRQTLDGALRLIRLDPTDPKAQEWEDTVIIVMPMKVLGVYADYRFSLNIGEVMPGVWDGPPYDPAYDPY